MDGAGAFLFDTRALLFVFFEIEGLGGKGELDSFGFEMFHDCEINPFVNFLIEPPVRRFDPVNDEDVQRAVIEVAEVYTRGIIRVSVHFRCVGQDVFYNFYCAFCFIAA